MRSIARILALSGALLVAGCASHEAYGVFGDSRDVFTGQMTGSGSSGRIELSNGKGVQCIGDTQSSGGGTQTAGTAIASVILGARISSSSGNGRALMSCSDGRQAFVQYTALGLGSGYGFGTTTDGETVKFTYGLSRDESGKYLGQQTASAAAAVPSGQRRSSGTGFFVTRQGHIVTNAHVVNGCASVTTARVGETPTAATVVGLDKQNDLAVLRSATSAPAVAALRGRPVRPGEAAIVFGFPFAGSLSSGGVLTTGAINALSGLKDDTRYYQISAPIQPGNSGGPLLDNTGAVAGVVTSGLVSERGSGPQNVNFALKADVVRTFLGSLDVHAESVGAGRELATPDIGDRARSFSVFIECRG
jgi:S1-C subfamily serine protease